VTTTRSAIKNRAIILAAVERGIRFTQTGLVYDAPVAIGVQAMPTRIVKLLLIVLAAVLPSCGKSGESVAPPKLEPTPGLRICSAAELPKEKWKEAQEKAIAENADNDLSGKPKETKTAGHNPFVDKGTFSSGRKWQNGKTLLVKCMTDSQVVERKIRKHAVLWEEFVHLKFEFGATGDAQIRIAFEPGEAWSKIGTDALAVPATEPTMNLGLVTRTSDEEEDRSVILHEFGHAIGLIHEHNHPQGGISWNREQVLADLDAKKPKWTPEMVEFNIFSVYNQPDVVFDTFDKESIMMYPIPVAWTTNGFTTGWNKQLSSDDKVFIAAQYPKPRQ
jgi:serralysin